MNFRPVRSSIPDAPVTLAEAKAHCRVDFADDDDLITALIQAATDHLDGYSGILARCMVTQTWSKSFAAWSSIIRLPFPDCSDVIIRYGDSESAEQTLSTALYYVLEDAVSSYVQFADDFTSPALSDAPAPIEVEFDSGFGAVADVPQALKQAILLLVSHWYENREAVGDNMSKVPMAVDMLIAPYRRMWV